MSEAPLINARYFSFYLNPYVYNKNIVNWAKMVLNQSYAANLWYLAEI